MNIFKRAYRKVKYHLIKNNIAKSIEIKHHIKKDMAKKYKDLIDNFESKEYKKEFSNKVFVCWFQGIENAPLLIQKCVESIKKSMPNKEVIVLTDDNYKDYTNFPGYIIEKYEKGIITKTHFSDLLRANLLINHGGLWLDSTVFCTAKEEPTYITKEPLFVFKDICLDRTDKLPTNSSSWLINACKHHPILELTQVILFEYWEHENRLANYFLYHIAFSLACDKYKEDFDNIPTFNNVSPHILMFELTKKYDAKRFEQIEKMSDFHKLNKALKTDGDVYTNYDFVIGRKKEN